MTPILYEDRDVLGKGERQFTICTTGNQFRDVSAVFTKYAQAPIRDDHLACRRVLRVVIRILTEVGWTQGTCYRDIHGQAIYVSQDTGPPTAACFCLVGAIETAVELLDKKYDRQAVMDNVNDVIYAAIYLRYDRKGESVFVPQSRVSWNDKVYRTPEEVVSLLNVALRIDF